MKVLCKSMLCSCKFIWMFLMLFYLILHMQWVPAHTNFYKNFLYSCLTPVKYFNSFFVFSHCLAGLAASERLNAFKYISVLCQHYCFHFISSMPPVAIELGFLNSFIQHIWKFFVNFFFIIVLGWFFVIMLVVFSSILWL